jgi:hypothetical protein
LIGNCVGALCASGEDIVDVRFILKNFFTALPHRREVFPEFLEQPLLQNGIAGAAFQKSFAHVCDFIPRRD